MSDLRAVGEGPLRRALLSARREAGVTNLDDVTVLSKTVDPFRLDTTSGHEIGQWLAEIVAADYEPDEDIHVRGLHYAAVGWKLPPSMESSPAVLPKKNGRLIEKPTGVYQNYDEAWEWMVNKGSKVARWLGYIPWDRVIDKKNDVPIIRLFDEQPVEVTLDSGVVVLLPKKIVPKLDLEYFIGRQPYRFAIVGEKSSLEPVLAPIADEFEADLFIPDGEISDPLIYTMAKAASADGRPLIVFEIADCDPSGYQMATSVSRKLDAFRLTEFPSLRYEVRPVGLTVEQVHEVLVDIPDLPSSPIKPGDKRRERWKAAYGIDQYEVDALIRKDRDRLRRMVREAIEPFFDATLAERVEEARDAWAEEAAERVEEEMSEATKVALDGLRSTAHQSVQAIMQTVAGIESEVELPEVPEVPEPDLSGASPSAEPLVSSSMSHLEQVQALKARKRYEEPEKLGEEAA